MKRTEFSYALRSSFWAVLFGLLVCMQAKSATSSIAVTITSGSPQTIPLQFNAGDTVTVTATLTTTDVNENGEGEPLVVVGPGCSITVAAYSFTQSTTCTASTSGSLMAYIPGADGDESATVSVQVSSTAPPPPPPGKTDTERQRYRNLRDAYGLLATFYWALSASPACLAAEPCGAWAGYIAAGDTALAIRFNRLAEDPADPNFMVIALPVVVTLPPFLPQPNLTQAEAESINRLLANQAEVLADIDAIITAFNRAQGAADAGNSFWYGQQIQTTKRLFVQLDQLLADQVTLLSTFQSALRAAGFPVTVISPTAILTAEQLIASGNSPFLTNLKTALQNFGADPATIAQALSVLQVQDANAAAGSFPAKITDPALIAALQAVAFTGPTIVNYQLLGQTPAGGGKFYLTYRADILNPGSPLGPVTASLTSLDPFSIRVLPGRGTLTFGSAPTNVPTTSSDTFSILADPSVPIDFSKLQWVFQSGPPAPIANAGSSQTVRVGSTVTLDGSSSSANSFGALTFDWRFSSRPPGSTSRLLYATTPTASFVPDVPGAYVVTLTVNNGAGSTSSSVIVTVTP